MKRLAVIGHPVAHSRSPAMQNAALAALGLAGEWSYEALDIAPADFAGRIGELEGEGFVGANVTIPHKEAALAAADEASDRAREIGAANTLTFVPGGIEAENTDAPGFLEALGRRPGGQHALVLGAGGSARAIVWALTRSACAVAVWNRTPERARDLAAGLGATALATTDVDLRGFDLLVNCTSIGLTNARPENAETFTQLPITADSLHDRLMVVDLVYRHGDTELVRAARERGATVVTGLEVLVRQGAESLRIWTDLEPPVEVMRRAAAHFDNESEAPA